ncbi:transporter [Paenibacillus sp. FSL P4-0081]|uniref:MMPL family transporter n=1 Tax=Paenibacillus sp. FSL P4-0081 TaxID=1536769 RepID=UPI0004F6CFC2|nr:MMPL family transporter [Paenibacillus sp. FSL P4-0081]AIQ31230.1 transporter [Paenibacillus sp. FSL P4-0081]
MSTFLYRLGKSAYSKPWYFIAAWIVVLGVIGALLGVNGIQSSSEMKIEGTESQKVLDKLTQELPAAAGGQASVAFTAPDGERLDTPERVALLQKAINDVYNMEYVINPMELAAQAAAAAQAAGADPSAAAGQAAAADPSAAAGQAAAADPSAAAGQAAAADPSAAAGQAAAADPSAAAGQAEAADPSAAAAAGQAAAAQSAPYGPLMADGAPVPGVMLSADGNIALFQFQFTVQQTSLPSDVPDNIIDTVTEVEQAGSGITAIPSDSLKSIPAIGSTEAVGVVVAAVVLFMTLGSVVAAGLPLITALLGVGISVGGAFALGSLIQMNDITPVLAVMIGLAVGIDYSLFIVNRQRRLILDEKLSAGESASRALGTAGSAVFFAGLTVIIALCGMLVIGIGFLSTMALVAAASVLINVLLALTLLPALLGLVGEKIVTAKARTKNTAAAKKAQHGFSHRWANATVKYRWVIIILVVLVLGTAAIPVTKMELGIPSGASANLDTPARQSYDVISKGFGEGFNGPLLLVAEPKNPSDKISMELLGKLTQELQMHDNVTQVSPMGVNATGDIAIISLIPKTGPTDTATRDLVQELRDPSSSLTSGNNINLGVTGFTAINIDMSSKLSDAFPVYIGIIVILSLIILLLVFRSIIVPIKATIGFVLSILATFGVTTAVYQWGWLHSLFGFDTGGPLLSFMPILVTGILYGLAMDYQVFLVSSMREAYVHGRRGNDSVVHGYDLASRVVLAAGVIMVSVFFGFIFAPDAMIKQIGFALAFGILIDAFIIRMTLVPAVMAVFGDKAWWLPKWLDRLLPNLDVEGDKLIAKLNAESGQKH